MSLRVGNPLYATVFAKTNKKQHIMNVNVLFIKEDLQSIAFNKVPGSKVLGWFLRGGLYEPSFGANYVVIAVYVFKQLRLT